MHLDQIWSKRDKPTVSFELFPAHNEKAEDRLTKVIDKLAAAKPDLVSVTFGAGGKTREGSHKLVKRLKQEKNLEVLAYFAGYGLGPEEITAVLDDYRDLGVDNLLVVGRRLASGRRLTTPREPAPRLGHAGLHRAPRRLLPRRCGLPGGAHRGPEQGP